MKRNDVTSTPATHRPTPHQLTPTAVELHTDREPVIYVPSAANPSVMVAVRRCDLTPTQPTTPRDLTPQPLIDPRAQLLASGGVLAAGAGWGIGQVVAPIAGMSTGSLMCIAAAVAAWKLGGNSKPTHIHHETHTHTHTIQNHNRWFGRSHSSS